MVKNVGHILDAAQRARLTALTVTSRKLDDVSLRLASGLKINSALDNPNAFFLARALTHRAGDLERLLDGIGQSIRTVQVAQEGIEAELKILDQADAYLQEVERKFLAGQVGLGTNETHITFSGPADITTYIVAQDVPASGTVTVTGNNEVTLQGNFWKQKLLNYNVTSQTVMTFDYRSTVQPEVSAIGLDDDMDFNNDNNRFYLYGTQLIGVNYSAPIPTYAYSGAGAWQSYEIPVGLYFTGAISRLAFINDDDLGPFGDASYRNIILREGPAQIVVDGAAFEEEYARILDQLDGIAQDAHYRGIHLLKNDTLTTMFNETRTSKLETQGMDGTRDGLGLTVEDFTSLGAVRAKMAEVRAARKMLQTYATTLATDLNVIQVRGDFTRGLANTHRAGADDLTLADMNEEGANMLALQTRQQVQMSILSLRPPNILTILT